MVYRETDPAACSALNGLLPACAPLANPYVPYQQDKGDVYAAPKGMIRGTLFPGLDLPFMGLTNRTEKTGPLAELQAVDFALNELCLYLDTHPEDEEALEMFNKYRELYLAGAKTYQEKYGPISRFDVGTNGKYNWLENPWPWDYDQGGNG